MAKPSKRVGKELEGQGHQLAAMSRGVGTGSTLSKKEKLDAGKMAAKRLIEGRKMQTLAQHTDHQNKEPWKKK